MSNETKKLGFGLMRLPRKGIAIDIPTVSKMVDLFLEAGFTYFDTAFVYPGSEKAIKQALVDRYPRESYTIATKMFAGLPASSQRGTIKQFQTSLDRTGAQYFDYYLLHSLMESNIKKYDKFDLWDFVNQQKEKGLIKNVGFSFHDTPERLDEILTKHPEVDFVQLQINYADWENPSVTSRANYEVARKHGKLITVVEPVKGGTLANPPKAVCDLFNAYNPNASYASWAIRFVASLDGILTVLSGMSTIPQMEDNISYMKDFAPLNEEEQRIIMEAQKIIGKSAAIPCTACGYCKKGCPQQIQIPEIFSALNLHLANGQTALAKEKYASIGHASDCIACRQCENVCPQHLPIVDNLKKAVEILEN